MKTFYYNLVLVLSVACGRLPETETSGDFAGSVPVFNVDPSWPKPLPGDWLLGQVSGLAVDWELR